MIKPPIHAYPATTTRLGFPCGKYFAFGLLLLVALTRTTTAIEVEQTRWGFDGQITIDRFTPLSVLLSNPTEQPVEATLRLQKSGRGGGSQKLGAPIVEVIYLSPFASRWVQFYPYMTSPWDEWSLTWGKRSDQRYQLKRPRSGPKASVVLVERDQLSTKSFSAKTFPENLFPTVVAATEHLQAVLLDHAPRWQKLRRDAFLGWIYRGGRVGLLPNQEGQYPVFGGDLSVLNGPLQKQHLGSGTVIRLDAADDKTINQFLLYSGVQKGSSESASSPTSAETPYDWQLGPRVTSALQQLAYPQHNWPLIHGLSLTYLSMLFPGWYLISRRRIDFRITLAAFLCVALSFGVIFHTVGRRGYGESTCVNSVAIARPLSSDSYDVIQWSNVFVTDGSTYKLSYGSGGHLYSTCQQFEQVHGIIDNGQDGYFLVDIPQFSSRNFAHHGNIALSPLEVEITSIQADEWKLEELKLKTGDPFPAKSLTVQIIYRNQIYRLSQQENIFQLASTGTPLSEYLETRDVSRTRTYTNNPWEVQNKPENPRLLYDSLLAPLIARALDIHGPSQATIFNLDEDRLRLLVYAQATPPFFIDNERLGRQDGYVLHVLDLFVPETP